MNMHDVLADPEGNILVSSLQNVKGLSAEMFDMLVF